MHLTTFNGIFDQFRAYTFEVSTVDSFQIEFFEETNDSFSSKMQF